MRKSAFTALALAALFATSPANAMLTCGVDYKKFWDTHMPPGPAAKVSGEQMAAMNRAALRAYDACLAGDEQSSKALLAKLAEIAARAKK